MSSRLAAQTLTELGSTLLYVLAAADLVRAAALLLAVSGVAAAVSFLNANQRPQKRWFEARAKAENLRSLYFLFLARQSPFNYPDPGDRVLMLRRKVLDVLRGQERPRTQPQGR